MITCNLCQTANGLDSKFCKNCGTALSDQALREASDKFDKTVQEGYALFNQGRTAEATLVAQSLVRDNPKSANAYSLLGMCYERSGQLAEALEAFEKVLDLSPESPLDRIKVSQLRNSLTQHMKMDRKSNKAIALITGVSAMVLVIVAGTFFAFSPKSKPPDVSAQNNKNLTAANVKTFDVTPQVNSPSGPSVQAAPNNPGLSQPVANPPVVQTPTLPQPNQVTQPAQEKPRSNENADSNDSGDSNSGDNSSDPPIKVGGTTPIIIQPESKTGDPAPQPSTSSDPAPTDSKPAQQELTPAQKTAAAQVPDDPGIIEIHVTRRSSIAAAGGNSGDSGGSLNELQALLKTARNEFMLGHYESAAKAYERAIMAGGDSAPINQRIGMCYEKLGRTDDAAVAYNRAISSYQGALNAGTGDSKRLKSGLEACKQALKLLKG